jgi:hypothetical protein
MWDYRAALVRVVDGDTVVLEIDQGFSGRQEEHIRLLDVRAPEKSQPGGVDTWQYVQHWAEQLPATRWPLRVMTVPNTNPEPSERRTLTRYLGTVVQLAIPFRNLNADVTAYLAEHPEWGPGY